MASVAPTMLAHRPHRRLLLAVLVISLVLNVCFVAGVAWTRWRAPPGGLDGVFRSMPTELDLDDKQRAAFERYVAGMRARSERVRQQVAPWYAGAWEEMAKPQADNAEVKRLFEQVGAKRQESQQEAVTQTLEFLSVLSADQRRKFVALMRERWSTRRNR